MDIATKLDFDSCDDDDIEEANMSTDLNNFLNHDSIRSSSPLHRPIFSPRKTRFSRPITSNLRHEVCDDSPPYKRIRALKLFDTPATPKTILEKCTPTVEQTPDEGRFSSCGRPNTRSRLGLFSQSQRAKYGYSYDCIEEEEDSAALVTPNSSVVEAPDQNTPTTDSKDPSKQSSNVNPFTPSGMLFSNRKRTRSRRELEDNSIEIR